MSDKAMLPSGSAVPHLILEQAARTPEAMAVQCAGQTLTYRELHLRAIALAARLRSLGVKEESTVALLAERSLQTVVSILAIHYAGGAYMPLDPEYPADLLAFVLADCGAQIALDAGGIPLRRTSAITSTVESDTGSVCTVLHEHGFHPVDDRGSSGCDEPDLEVRGDQLAYVIYTSGSTGRPKGVLVTHANLAHSTRARLTFYRRPPKRFLLLSSFAFDSSVAGLFWTLCAGGTLVLAQGEERDPAALAVLIGEERITHTLCLPSVHALLIRAVGNLDSLETVIVAGESCPPALPAEHARRLPGAELFNEYGPTEATVWSTVARLTPPPPVVSIGHAIPGAEVRLLDEAGEPVPDGEPGEIHIGGPGVARGYLNRPELTAARFLTTVAGSRLYKSGDLARRLADGQLEFLGRTDRQVKIRGYRVELEAIETVLRGYPDVQDAVVLVREDEPGRTRLVAYVMPADCGLPGLRALLAGKLPSFMQPSDFVALDTFPRMPNGKVDRTALPAPGGERPALETIFVEPRDALEGRIADDWRVVLDLDRVGIHDKFFDLGGDSLMAAMVCGRLQEMLGEPVFVVALFEAPTVSQLATYLRQHYPAALARVLGEESPAKSSRRREIDAARLAGLRKLIVRTPESTTMAPPLRTRNRRAIFILAPPRSGTTLLRAMLAGHPGLCTASELRLLGFRTLGERRAAYAGSEGVWRQGLLQAIAECKGCDAAEAAHLLGTYERLDLGTGEFYALLQQWLGERVLVDKSPSYALDPACLRHAEALFADAFYIHLARHPYEMIRSFESRHMDRVYLPGAADITAREAGEAVWLIAHRNICDFLATIPAERRFDLRFSDLVTRPRESMEALCAALGIAFDSALLDPYRGAPAAVENGIHTPDDPRFLEHGAIKAEVAEGWRGVLEDNFLSDLTWDLAEELGFDKPKELERPHRESPPRGAGAALPCDAIAIVGMAGRFPGARNVDEFWRNLCNGVESIRSFTAEELRASGIDPAIVTAPGYVNAGAQIDDADKFAASFFGYTPREAELMDPQQRVFLECAWEAFEHAGCDVSRSPGAVGVFAGLALNDYFQFNLATRPELTSLLGTYAMTLGNEKDFVATRVAYKLGLRGPAIGVQTACSTSLVALHLACQSLRSGESDMALVGGGRINVPLHAGYPYVDGGIPSPDGHCRAFDAHARGCVPASGIAVVVVKRLADALRDGDCIYSVIRGSAINNDAGNKAGFTAPSVEGQADAIARAHTAAGVTADTIGYVEAHGTGTSLGDPIEIAALTRAFRKTADAVSYCRIGSVKTNIGHLDTGAGAAGLIKAALALDRGVIPPSLYFTAPNPQIDFARSPFVVNATLTAWPRGTAPRRAGVSSFGIGGTNAHVILEEAPLVESSPPSRPWQLLVLSARAATALEAATANLARHLRENPGLVLADVAHTLQSGRREFEHRRIVVARDLAEAADALEMKDPRRVITATAGASAPEVVFMFPGQGAQYSGMARELFEGEPIFHEAMLQCAEILRPHFDLLGALYPTEAGPQSIEVTATAIAQPAIFAVEYALARLWKSWGIQPAAVLGHSVGEFAAACVAEVFSLEDALTLLAGRARLMQEMPGGAMLAVRLSEADLQPHLGSGVELAAINSPRLCVVSGPHEGVAAFAERMAALDVACVPLRTSHAFHSAMMEPAIAPFTVLASSVKLRTPRLSIVSSLTGGAADFTQPQYWTQQLREPVRFAAAAAFVAKERLLLEVGPGSTLAALARQSREGAVVASQAAFGEREHATLLEALGRLWLAGVAIDWKLLHGNDRRLRVPLPAYPFERERYWLEPGSIERRAGGKPAVTIAADPALESKRASIDELREFLHGMSGVAVEKMAPSATLLELGFDSLFLTQVALALRKKFGIEVAFRQLFEELSTIEALAKHLEGSAPSRPHLPAKDEAKVLKVQQSASAHGPFRPIQKDADADLTETQLGHLTALTARYTARTSASKRKTQQDRAHFADPRSVSGFRPYWKELTYPIIIERSIGSKLWDADGHEYIDFTMGYGTNLLGHSPPFITEAIAAQLARGIEIGPQSPIAGEIALMLCEASGMDRAAFTNTGSEAVLAAVRVARTVTGRARFATFSGYHGINDEFLIRGKTINGERRSMPIAPGIPEHTAHGVLALDYGTPESLELLRTHAHELAAVLVEPVQSRHPDLQPREFLQEVRRITQEAGVALVFDEVITGFRCHPGGAQAWFDVRADLVTYGKIIGGGMPMGALCGRRLYMDALDGGAWNFGDNSRPEAGVTFFAGTFVRHPLALAASRVMLAFLRDAGPSLQSGLNGRAAQIAGELNAFLEVQMAPMHIESFASMFFVKFADDFNFGALLFFHLREKGIHAWDNRLLFLSTAHTDEDISRFIRAFHESVEEMQAGGFLPQRLGSSESCAPAPNISPIAETNIPPRTAIPLPVAGKPGGGRPLQFSIYFFGNYPAAFRADKYRLIIESTRFADTHGFSAVWLPERHFHSVGGFSPNAAVMAAALARETKRIQLRAGSVVLPLHHPVRVAEEWSLVDNLSDGRVGISIASGWHPNDFVFAPEAYENRRELCAQSLDTIRKLWRGEAISARSGAGNEIPVSLFPLPRQPELPVWLTCVKTDSWVRAGELGLNVLAQLQNQSLEEVAERIRLYREARARAGHDRGHVTMLLHTFLADDAAEARSRARGPLRDYLRSHVEISQRKLKSQSGSAEVADADLDFLLTRAADDYAQGKAFIGTPDTCAGVADKLHAIGVDEAGCLIDFGIAPEAVLASLPQLDALRRRCMGLGSPEICESSANEDSTHESPATLPLTPAQRGLYALAAKHADSSRAYNESSALELRGPLDGVALKAALQALVDRHEALRTSFAPDGETMTVAPQVSGTLPVIDCPTADDLSHQIATVCGLRFDLSRAPIMDARLLSLGAEHHVLVITLHHILCNGPSLVALYDDLSALYTAHRRGTAADLPPAMQLRDFVQRRLKPTRSEAEAFWKMQFAHAAPPLDLPLDRPRPATKTYRGARETMRLDAECVTALRRAGASHGASLFMTLLSAFQALLHRLSGRDDVVVGVPFEGNERTQPGGEHLIANTTNVAPLRSRIAEGTTFAELLAANRRLVLAASEHQEYFFGDLIGALNLPFDASRSPLFNALFNYETGRYERDLDGLSLKLVTDREPYLQLRDTAMFELYLNVAEHDGALLFRCDYNCDLFAAATVQRWLGHLRMLLSAVAVDSSQQVMRLSMLSTSERALLVQEWNRTALDYPRDATLHQLVEETVLRQPDSAAIVDHGHRISYGDLDAQANAIAAQLQSLGMAGGEFVGVCMRRSAEMIAAILGVLKAGAAYVPLDPAYPHERLALMLEDSGASVVLCDAVTAASHGPKHPSAQWVQPGSGSAPALRAATAQDLAYLIYTSGSTGRPKGVALKHCNAVAFVHWARQVFTAEELSGVLASTSICFDLSIFEIFVPLATGGAIVLAENVLEFPSLPDSALVTLVNTVPSAMAELVRGYDLPPNVRTVNLAGEPLPEPLVAALYRGGAVRRVLDLYGPTETTTYSTFAERRPGEPATIGRPIGNTEVYVLDANLEPVPIGVTGDVYIGGAGVARGYWRQPELTAERFFANPFGTSTRIYKTGDLAHWRADGQLVYLGRSDDQVKVRGFRIELGEIEATLARLPAIREAVVVARTEADGEIRLIAYVVSVAEMPTPQVLREHLKQRLPDYMVPAAFVALENLPRTANGKLDRRALPVAGLDARAEVAQIIEPRDEAEQGVAEIWRQVLKIERVGVHENFFDLGGHSLAAMQVASRLRSAGKAQVSFLDVFERPTIAGLAEAIRDANGATEIEEGVL